MKLRPATMADAEQLHAWRNDDHTREMSVRSDEVPLADHLQWLASVIENPRRELLIAEVDDVPVGTVRLDHGDEVEVSYTVAPNARGKGYGTTMVKMVAPMNCVAAVQSNNAASQRILANAGFTLVEGGRMEKWKRCKP